VKLKTSASVLINRWWPALVVLIAGAVAVRQCLRFEWKLDDAYIAFAYAQNWVHGHGLVFNIGERVEGYTCFLWVVLCAVGLALGVDVATWSTWLGIASAVGTVLATWRLTRALAPAGLQNGAVVSAVLVCGYPALTWWAASGMETALFTCLVTLAMWRHVRDGADSVAAPVCLALASMTRPEGWLLSGLLCLDVWRARERGKAARYVGIFVAIFGPYYAWRVWYYGYPFPNTFYAKVGNSPAQVLRGLEYLHTFVATGGGGVLLVGLAAALWARVGRRAAVLYVFLSAYLAYVVLVGGDVFAFHRFLIPVVPAMIALGLAGILAWAHWLRPERFVGAYACCAVYAAALALSCITLYRAQMSAVHEARWMDGVQHAMCRCVTAHTQPDDAIASVGIGVLKFCTGLPVIDMVGLTDEHIAHQDVRGMGEGLAGHEKYDSRYVLARWPKYVMISHKRVPPFLAALEDMWGQPLFRQYFREYSVAHECGYRRIEEPGEAAFQ
jgi:hypothetical protein